MVSRPVDVACVVFIYLLLVLKSSYVTGSGYDEFLTPLYDILHKKACHA